MGDDRRFRRGVRVAGISPAVARSMLTGAWATARAVRRSPVSVGLVLTTWLLGLSTRSVLDGPSAGLRANVVFSVADSWTHPLSLLASVFWPTGLRGIS